MPLTQEQRDQLNGIIGRMKQNNESEDSIKEMVSEFKAKHETPGKTMREAVPAEGTITQGPRGWVPWARSGVEMAGYGLGAAGGTALAGPWGGRAGAGLGYAGARQLNRVLFPENPLMRPEKPGPTLGERAIEIGKDIGIGGLMKGAEEKVINPVIRKVLPFYAKGGTPGAQEITNIAEREGVRVPAADVTGNVGQAAVSSSLQKLPQSGNIMQKEAETALGQFADYTERTLGKLGGKVEPGTAGEIAKEAISKKGAAELEGQLAATGGKVPSKLVGPSVQEGVAVSRKGAEDTGSQFYTQAANVANEANAQPTFSHVPEAINAVKTSDHYKLMSEAGKKEVDNFIDLIAERTGSAGPGEIEVMGVNIPRQISQQGGRGFVDEGALEGAERAAKRITDFLGAEGFRKTLAKNVYSKSTKGLETFDLKKQILDAYEDDMMASSGVAQTAYKAARDFWAKNVFGRFGQPGGKNIITKLQQASPDTVIDTIKSSNVKDLTRLVDVLPEEHLARVQNGLLTDIVESGSVKKATGEIIPNGPQIAKAIRTIGDDRLNVLFSPDQVRYLRDLATAKAGEGQIFKIATETAGYAFRRLKNAEPEEIALIKNNLKPEEFTKYRQGLITHIFQRNSKESPTTGEIIYNGTQIAKDLFGKSGLGEQKLKTLVTSEEFAFLKDFAKLGDAMGSSWRLAGNPSGTAHQLYMLHLLGQVGKGGWRGASMMLGGAAAGGAATSEAGGGWKEITGGGAMGAFLAPWMVAKLITSNLGRRYLMSGFPKLERGAAKAFPYGVIATRGILSSPEKEEQPVIRGGLPFESRQYGGPVVPEKPSVNDEVSLASEAIEKGIPIEEIRKMFRERTGQEL